MRTIELSELKESVKVVEIATVGNSDKAKALSNTRKERILSGMERFGKEVGRPLSQREVAQKAAQEAMEVKRKEVFEKRRKKASKKTRLGGSEKIWKELAEELDAPSRTVEVRKEMASVLQTESIEAIEEVILKAKAIGGLHGEIRAAKKILKGLEDLAFLGF